MEDRSVGGRGGAVPTTDMAEWYRIEIGLLAGHSDNKQTESPGLLSARPRLFLPVAFGIVAGHERVEAAQKRARLSRIVAALGSVSVQPPEESVGEPRSPLTDLLRELTERCQPVMSLSDALGDLEDDLDVLRRKGENSEIGQLLQEISSMSAGATCDVVRDVMWPAVRNTTSAAARVQLLSDLVGEGPALRCAETIDEILLDQRLYHCVAADYALWCALRFRWPDLSVGHRDAVLRNIRALQFSPTKNGIYAVGALLDAVPEVDRPADLIEYLEIYRLQRWNPAPSDPDRPSSTFQVEQREDDEFYERFLKISDIDADCENLWRACARQDFDSLLRATPEECALVVDRYRNVLRGCLPDAARVELSPWLLQHWQRVIDWLVKERGDGAPDLAAPELRIVAEWALRIAASQDERTVNGNQTPLAPADVYQDERLVWSAAIELLDSLLSHKELIRETSLRDLMFEEVERVRARASPIVARRLFTGIRRHHWVSSDLGGKSLRELLGRTSGDPEALRWAVPLLACLSEDECRRFVQRWLEEDDAVAATGARGGFVRELGMYLGRRSLARDPAGEHRWHRAYCDSRLQVRPTSGAIGSDDAYCEWTIGVLRGARSAADRASPDAAGDYAGVIGACWKTVEAFSPGQSVLRPGTFPVVAFNGAFSRAKKPAPPPASFSPVDRWWRALQPVAREVVRRGAPGDVSSLLFGLRERATIEGLGPATLYGMVTALDERSIANRDGLDLRYAVEFVKNLALSYPVGDPMIAEIHAMLEHWPPVTDGLLEAKREIRVHGAIAG